MSISSGTPAVPTGALGTTTATKTLTDATKVLMRKVLKEFVKCGVIGEACRRAGVTRRTHTDWVKEYPTYNEAYNDVKERFIDALELVAMERAREKSDSLLMKMLSAHRREVYGERTEIDLTVSQKPVQLVFAQGMLSKEEEEMVLRNQGGVPAVTQYHDIKDEEILELNDVELNDEDFEEDDIDG